MAQRYSFTDHTYHKMFGNDDCPLCKAILSCSEHSVRNDGVYQTDLDQIFKIFNYDSDLVIHHIQDADRNRHKVHKEPTDWVVD